MTDSLPRGDDDRRPPVVPDVVQQVARYLASLEPDELGIRLAAFSFDLARVAGVAVSIATLDAEAVKRRAGFFMRVQATIAQTLLKALLGVSTDPMTLMGRLYEDAVASECESAVSYRLRYIIPAPLPRQRCPCCGYYTLQQRGHHEICKVCGWQDEWRQLQFAEPPGNRPIGANRVGLDQARANYLAIGAKEKRLLPHVRPPLPEELPENQPPAVPPL